MPKTTTYSSQFSSGSSGSSSISYNKYKPYKGLQKQVRKSEKKVNSLMEKGFNAPYQSQLKDTVNKINKSKFEYDLNEDALYNQYRDMYQGMGNVAMQEAQADATALTGGFANSYAETAGQQAYNSYIQELQNLVPQLYGQARSNYDAELANLYNQANLYSGLNAQSFTEYAQGLENAMANRDYNYNKYNTMRQASAKQVSKEKSWNKQSNKSSTTSK